MTASVHVAGWTLVHFVWQGALVGLVAATTLWLLRSASAQTRYLVACAALAAMMAAPIITARMLSVSDVTAAIDLSPSVPSHDTVAHTTALGLFSASSSPARQRVPMRPVRAGLDAILPLVVAAWLVGVAFLLLRLAGGWWRVRRLHGDALALEPSHWQAVSEGIASRLHLQRHVHVVDFLRVDTPTALGWLRPVVLLPIAALANLAPAQVEAILVHELAHIRRHDYVVNLLQTVAETLLFYHPAVWWVSARIRAEREHCCDDVAVSVCGDAVGYASALAELESWRTREASALALAATGGSLLDRVRRMLEGPAGGTRSSSSAVITLALAVLLVVIAGGRHLPAWQAVGSVRQTASSPTSSPTFEAASVKPNKAQTQGGGGDFFEPGDRWEARNYTLRELISVGYRLPSSRVIGGPAWMDADRFDVVAKAASGSGPRTPSDDIPTQMFSMIRTLVADRFRLMSHSESRNVPIYALIMAERNERLGPQLHRTTDVHCGSFGVPCGVLGGPGHLGLENAPLSLLVRRMSPFLDRIVEDRTGLTGRFDGSLDWTPDQIPSDRPADLPPFDPKGPSIFTALQEQLGLKLESTKGPVDILVIESAEHPTAD